MPFNQLDIYKDLTHSNSSKLTPIGTTYIEPMGLYSKKVKSLNDLPNGAKIAIPDNPYNTTRALRLLETAGLIKLSADFKEGTGTPSDIVENKKNFEFLLIDDTTSVRVLDDADLIAIGNTIALEGGLNVLKMLYSMKKQMNLLLQVLMWLLWRVEMNLMMIIRN